MANKTKTKENKFTLYSNLIYYSLTKSKRVTRSVLASKIYGMVVGADMAFAISFILKMIIKQLDLPAILTIVYTDLYLLYKYLGKLGITKEKRLIIDIIAIRQSYKRRKLFKI